MNIIDVQSEIAVFETVALTCLDRWRQAINQECNRDIINLSDPAIQQIKEQLTALKNAVNEGVINFDLDYYYQDLEMAEYLIAKGGH